MKSFQLQKCWKLLDVHRVSGPCRVMWGDSIRKRNVSPRLFSLECCLHCFTDNQQMLVGFFYSSFSRPSPSKPLRSKPKSCSWIHVQSGRRDHSGGHREETALRLQECMNELSAGAVSLREQQCVNLCFALMNYKKENPVNAFMFWRWNIDMMKRNCSTMKSCLAARRQSTEIIPPRKTVFRSGRRWYCIFRQHNSQIRNLVTTFTSLFLN